MANGNKSLDPEDSGRNSGVGSEKGSDEEREVQCQLQRARLWKTACGDNWGTEAYTPAGQALEAER